MAYWFAPNQKIGASGQAKFLMDTDTDVSSLPTSTTPGEKQTGNDVVHLPCGKGSIALSITSANIYVLNSQDEWVEFGDDE